MVRVCARGEDERRSESTGAGGVLVRPEHVHARSGASGRVWARRVLANSDVSLANGYVYRAQKSMEKLKDKVSSARSERRGE